jgi:hypothetical protein
MNYSNIEELNENFLVSMNKFLSENWSRVPSDFLEKISSFVDSLMIENSFLKDSSAVKLFYSETSVDAVTEEGNRKLLKKLMLDQKVNNYISNKSVLVNAVFFDDCFKKSKTFLKSMILEDQTIESMEANQSQKSDYEGFIPVNIVPLALMINNNNFLYKNSEHYYRFPDLLVSFIISFKMELNYSAQESKLKKLSQKQPKDSLDFESFKNIFELSISKIML